jgi:hypothetical protein
LYRYTEGWKVDVTLEANKGAQARTVATLLLRDDLSQLQREMLEMQLRESNREVTNTNNTTKTKTNNAVVNRYTTREITRTIYKDAGGDTDSTLRGGGERDLLGGKQNATVRDLREVAADVRELPFDRTILRYRDARGKEIINDAATLERKKVFTVNEVNVEEERDDPFYVYHEVELYKLNPVETHSLKAPGFSTLEPQTTERDLVVSTRFAFSNFQLVLLRRGSHPLRLLRGCVSRLRVDSDRGRRAGSQPPPHHHGAAHVHAALHLAVPRVRPGQQA